MDAYFRRVGCHLRKEDLAAHQAEWVEPLSTTYRGATVYELPPNGQGLAALQMLNVLEGYDLAAMGHNSADALHVLVEAKKLAFADRARLYADPEFYEAPLERLLSKQYSDERRGLIDMEKAAASVDAGLPERGDTIYLCTADSSGMMVSLIQSNYRGMGSGMVPDGMGFMLQDRGELFALEPGHPNVYAPGKRPFHTIIPAFATRDGKPWLAFGLMGGAMQPQGHVQILCNLLDFGMNLQEAGGRRPLRALGFQRAHRLRDDRRRHPRPRERHRPRSPRRARPPRAHHPPARRLLRRLPGHRVGCGEPRLPRRIGDAQGWPGRGLVRSTKQQVSFPHVFRRSPRVSVSFVNSLVFAALAAISSAAGSHDQDGAEAVPLEPAQPWQTTLEPPALGRLYFLGGFELFDASADEHSGSISALHVDPKGTHCWMVTDTGNWMRAQLQHDQGGRLTGFEPGTFTSGRLIGPDGKEVKSWVPGKWKGYDNRKARRKFFDDHIKPDKDKYLSSESMAVLSDGTFFVSSEGTANKHGDASGMSGHRVWRFASEPRPFASKAENVTLPCEAHLLNRDRGIEAMSTLQQDRLILLAEGRTDKKTKDCASCPDSSREKGRVPFWVIGTGPTPEEPRCGTFVLAHEDLGPSAAATLPSGDLLVLQRHYYGSGRPIRIAISRITASALALPAGDKEWTLDGRADVLVDSYVHAFELWENFEGMSAWQRDGRTFIALVSDDNHEWNWGRQRTFFLQFELDDADD